MLGSFCQLGMQMLQKVNDPKMKTAQLVTFKAAVSNKLVRQPQLNIDINLQPEISNLIYFNI
jgi:hypothetical protein